MALPAGLQKGPSKQPHSLWRGKKRKGLLTIALSLGTGVWPSGEISAAGCIYVPSIV